VAEVQGGQHLDNVLKAIAKKLKGGGTVRIGFLEDATYPDGTSVAMVAAIQEYGAPARGIPPRPFFRNMIRTNAADWPRRVQQTLEANDYDAEKTLAMMGEGIARQLRQSIIDTNAPALSNVTLLLRERFPDGDYEATDVWQAFSDSAAGIVSSLSGSGAKPLVWTGHMLASVDYEVETSDGEVKRGSGG
jgi:ABC-type transport system substrate-binding protein